MLILREMQPRYRETSSKMQKKCVAQSLVHSSQKRKKKPMTRYGSMYNVMIVNICYDEYCRAKSCLNLSLSACATVSFESEFHKRMARGKAERLNA